MTFDVLQRAATGERVVVRQHATEGNGQTAVADLYAAPGAAPSGEHQHPLTTETFTVVRGTIGVKVGDDLSEAGPGARVSVPPGVSHNWWNKGSQTAFVIVEVGPAPRFEEMMKNLFFLAADGKTDARGKPNLLQASLLAREFDDMIRFSKPPRAMQRILFGALAPIARLRGYRGSYAEYAERVSDVVDALEELPPEIAAMLPPGVPGALRTQ